MTVATTVVVVALVTATAVHGQAEGLRLRAATVLPAPRDSPVLGGTVGGDGTVVVWTQTQVVLYKDGTMVALCPDLVSRPVAVRQSVEGVVEVVDGEGGAIARWAAGHCERISSPPRARTLEGAAAVGNGWYVWFRDGGAAQMGFLATSVAPMTDVPDGRELAQAAIERRVSIRPDSDGRVLVVERHWPFSWRRLSAAGVVFETGGGAAALAEFLDEDEARGWRSLGAVSLGNGVLQTLADPRSDRRVLLRYGPDGVLERGTEIEAPLGVLASAPASHLLLAVRILDREEVIVYRWQ